MESHLHSHRQRHLHGARGIHGHSHGHGVPGPRIPARMAESFSVAPREAINESGSFLRQLPARLLARSTCKPGDDSPECEKPVSASSLTIPITIAVVGVVVLGLGAFIFMHRRASQRHKAEDVDVRYKSMDFGMGEAGAGGKKKNAFGGGEKGGMPSHAKGLSMDMNLSSPYLLPPTVHESRESLNSLAKTLHQPDDPYRSIATFSDVGSLRSYKTGHGSTYTKRESFKPRPLITNIPVRQNSLPTAPLPQAPPAAANNTLKTPEPQEAEMARSAPPSKTEFSFTNDDSAMPQVPAATGHVDMPAMPSIQEPAPVASRNSPSSPLRPLSNESIVPGRPFGGALAGDGNSAAAAPAGLGIMETSPTAPPTGALPDTPKGGRRDSKPIVSEVPSEYEDYAAGQFQFALAEDEDDDVDTRPVQKVPEQVQPHSAGLDVPQNKKSNRLSVGVRPLPPNEMLESDDAESRAMRIRSFYKEYFDDSKEAKPPMPQPQSAQYYEDLDPGYGEAAYFDPDSNAFVMPYAEPVTRRAMTPPPSNRRPMPGPRARGPGGPGPGPHGPMGPGPRGPPGGFPGPRPRAGSSYSAAGRWAQSPRPGSSASHQGGSRPPGPRKPMPPPAALNTLPTPSKLKDDAFLIEDPIAFAPPPTLKDVAAGRSQSPLGERRPYQLNVPVASPMSSAFDNIPDLPSPHLLRKSSTFTSLDFAPPRKFKDPEAMSDAGSVHSVGSGISSRANSAIRSGAGRVSRLPEDSVFSQAAMGDQLKPQWGMRN